MIRPAALAALLSLGAAPVLAQTVTADEVRAAADGAPTRFTSDQVLDRVERLGDLFAA